MNQKQFYIQQALRFGWNITKQNPFFFINLIVFIWVVNGVIGYFSQSEEFGPAILGTLVSAIRSVFVSMGLMSIYLKYCDGQKAEFSDLFSQATIAV